MKIAAITLILVGLLVGCTSSPSAEGKGSKEENGTSPSASKTQKDTISKSKPTSGDPKPRPKPKPKPQPDAAKVTDPGDGKVPVDSHGSVYGLPLDVKVRDIEVPERLKGPTPASALKVKKS